MSKKKSATKNLTINHQKTKSRNNFAIWGLFFVVFVMTATLLGIFFLQKPVEEVSLDTRKAAMVKDGIVNLEVYPFDQSTIKLGESQTVDFQLNTKDAALNYIELNLEVEADENLLDSNKIQFANEIPSSLEIEKEEIAETSCDDGDCFIAKLVLKAKDSAIPYTTNNENKTIAKLNFRPAKEGSFELELKSDSKVLANNSQEDLLGITSNRNFEFFVTENGIDPAQCYYDYSDWSYCKDGWQSRTYEVKPNNCHWHEEEELKDLSQYCYDNETDLVTAKPIDFYLSTSKTCWTGDNDGSDIVINWNAERYTDVTWIDMSRNSEFDHFFHKKVEGNVKTGDNGFLMVDASNMLDSQDGHGPFVFEADEDYFFRLYSEDGDGYHMLARKFEIDYCDGEAAATTTNRSTTYVSSGRSYLPSEYYDLTTYSCNHGCNTNRDCDAGLRCYQGKCRSADNPTDSTCLVGKVIEESETDATDEAEIATEVEEVETEAKTEETETQNAFVERKGLNINSLLFGILSSFSWQWLAIAGLILIVSIALIIIGIARSKKDPWADVKSFEQEETKKKAIEEKRKVIIPENKPLEIEKEPETPPQIKR